MKKYLLLLIIPFMFISNVYAVDVSERTLENNYGVNKKWEVTDRNRKEVLETPLIDSSEKIYDFANVLDKNEMIEVKANIDKFIELTNMDMVIVTINEPYYRYNNNDYEYHAKVATNFYDYNDFGIDFNHYSGVLLLRNTYNDDPYYNVFMFGDAQLYFSYSRAEDMLDSVYDYLHTGDYKNGFNRFINMYTNYYNRGIPSSMRDYIIGDELNNLIYIPTYHAPYHVAFIISIIVTLIVVLVYISRNKMVHKEIMANEYLDKNSIEYLTKTDNLINTRVTHYRISSSSSSGGGHSGGFGSSGGGFSSGGGRHG